MRYVAFSPSVHTKPIQYCITVSEFYVLSNSLLLSAPFTPICANKYYGTQTQSSSPHHVYVTNKYKHNIGVISN